MVGGEFDLLPEEIDWRDEGCKIHPSCLNCPLERCIEEEPRGKQRLKAVLRAGRIAQLRRSGKSVREIADIFEVSHRTVQRALKNQKSKRKMTKQNSKRRK
jgi:transposase-like protein